MLSNFIKIKTLYQAKEIKRNLPVNNTFVDNRTFSHELVRVIPESNLFIIKNYICDSDLSLFSLDYQSIPSEFCKNRVIIKISATSLFAHLLKKVLLNKFIISVRPICLVIDNWSIGYFHWLHDVLPRIIAIKDLCIKYGIILPNNYKNCNYVVESLNLLGVYNVYFLKIDTLNYFKRVYFPTHIAPTGNYNDTVTKVLRNHFLSLDFVSRKPTKKIYLSRSLASKRQIKNEVDLISVLTKYDFEIVHCETLSFKEQINLFANTQYLISNHGAGLANMLFMQNESKVLELRAKDDSQNNCYFSLASTLQIYYYFMYCDKENIYESTHSADLVVDKIEFEKLVVEYLS